MKLLLLTMLTGLAVLSADAAETFTIVVDDTTGLVAGPFTHGPAAGQSQHSVTLTSDQITAVNALRIGNPGARLVFDGQNFSVHPTDVLRAALITEYLSLSLGEQRLYRSAFAGVREMLDHDNLPEAKLIIFLSPVPTEELAAARARMLALFPEG